MIKFLKENFAVITTLIIGLLSGKIFSDWIDIDRKALTAYAVPLSDTQLSINTGTSLWGDNQGIPNTADICTISGLYSIRNTGEYPWIIENAIIEIYELPPINAGDVPKRNEEQVFHTRTLSNYLRSNEPFVKEPISVTEQVGPNGKVERAFEIRFRVPKAHLDPSNEPYSFAIAASAEGGRINRKGNISKKARYQFKRDDLLHINVESRQCLR